MTAATAPGARAFLLEAVRIMAALAVVMGIAVAALVAADALPAYLTGDAHDVKRARTIDEAERRLRTRLVLPFYFPDTLAWPPRRIRFVLGPPGAAALEVEGRGRGARLLIAETTGLGAIPERLVPPAQELQRSTVAVGAAEATLSRVLDEGEPAWQLAWEQGGRSMLLRRRGSLDELVRMARSVREAP